MVRATRVVDLSVALGEDTQVFPGDPVLRTSQATTVAAEGFNVLHLVMGSQTGTHVDAPYHVRDDGLRIDELPLGRFLAPLVVVDLRGLAPRQPITWDDVSAVGDRLGEGVALVLRTGWSERWGTPEYFDHPWLDLDATARVIALGVRTIGLDAPNLDETVLDAGRPELPAHQLIAAVDGVIVENLTGLGQVDFADPLLSVLPLRLRGGDGAPCRAVALQVG